jgi:hypothetical protein
MDESSDELPNCSPRRFSKMHRAERGDLLGKGGRSNRYGAAELRNLAGTDFAGGSRSSNWQLSGSFQNKHSGVFNAILSTVKAMLGKADNEKVAVSELHLDFDCAESRLSGYAVWVAGLKRALRFASVAET